MADHEETFELPPALAMALITSHSCRLHPGRNDLVCTGAEWGRLLPDLAPDGKPADDRISVRLLYARVVPLPVTPPVFDTGPPFPPRLTAP